MRLGYRRAVEDDRTLLVQQVALAAAGCDLLFEDIVLSGVHPARTGLAQLLEALRADDFVVVWCLDQLAPDFTGMLEVLAHVLVTGARVVSLQENLDSDRMGSAELSRVVKALLSHKGNIEAERALAERKSQRDASHGPGCAGAVSSAQRAGAREGFEVSPPLTRRRDAEGSLVGASSP